MKVNKKYQSSQVLKGFGKTLKSMDIGADIVRLTDGIFDYCKLREQEKTKRTELEERGKSIRKMIEAKKEVIIKAIDRHYDHKKFVYENLFSQLSQSKEAGDKEIAQGFMSLISAMIHKDSFQLELPSQSELERIETRG